MTSIFGGGSGILSSSGTLVPQSFIPTDGQTVFTITSFSYVPDTTSILVFINGQKQRYNVDYTETSSTSFTLTSSVTANDIVEVLGFPKVNISVNTILDGAVTTAKILDNAVTTAKIAPDAVTAAQIADGAVGTTELAGAAVTAAKIADGAVTNTKIADSSVTAAKLASGAAVSNIGAGGISANELASNAVTTAKVLDANITPAKLSQPFTSVGAVAPTSNAIDFLFPAASQSWIKRITIIFLAISTNGTSQVIVQAGSGSPQTTGYSSVAASVGGAVTTTFTTGFGVGSAASATDLRTGHIVLTKQSGNTWVCSSILGIPNSPGVTFGAGLVSLSNTIDRVRITTVNGTDVFDGGSISLFYE